MEDKELISIIVPVYNVSLYLRKCFDSLLAQTYRELDIIAVDDGSTDGSGRICDEYAEKDARIRVFHTENHGLSAARNVGLIHARGNLIGFLDSDDWVAPEMLETLAQLIIAGNADVAVCGMHWAYGEADWIMRHGKPIAGRCNQVQAFDKAVQDEQFYGYVCNKLFRHELIGEQRFDEELLSLEDFDFTAEYLTKISTAAYTDAQLYYYRQRGNSMTGDFRYSKRKLSILNAYERIIPIYRQFDQPMLPQLQRNYLKIALNIQGRMKLSHMHDPAVEERLRNIVDANYEEVMRSEATKASSKLNIFVSKRFPGTVLKAKQAVLRIRNRKRARKETT